MGTSNDRQTSTPAGPQVHAGGEKTIAAPDFPNRGISDIDPDLVRDLTPLLDRYGPLGVHRVIDDLTAPDVEPWAGPRHGYMSGVRPPARLAADASPILCPSCKHPIDHHGAPGTGCVIPHHDDTDILCPCLHSPNWIAHTLLMALSDSADTQLQAVPDRALHFAGSAFHGSGLTIVTGYCGKTETTEDPNAVLATTRLQDVTCTDCLTKHAQDFPQATTLEAVFETSLPIAAVADLVSAAVDSAIRGTLQARDRS